MLKLRSTARESMACRSFGSALASVVTYASMVAMLGWIMPLPLAMAPMRTVPPEMGSSYATSFFSVSVVMMAQAASPPLSRPMFGTMASSPLMMRS